MADRRRARGAAAAAAYLARLGLQIVARNVRLARGEIDLVCWEGAVHVFVEVKARGAGWGDPPAAAVTAVKQRRLRQLAAAYLKGRGLRDPRCRFDVVSVILGADGAPASIRHLPGAFTGEAW